MAERLALDRDGAGSIPAPGPQFKPLTLMFNRFFSNRSTNPIGSGYAWTQLSKALSAVDSAVTAVDKQNAEKRVQKWQSVINNMQEGVFQIGSRTPIRNAPSWVTLEVVTGGFVTGKFLAGGELAPDEVALCAKLQITPDEAARRYINAYYLSDEGLALLNQYRQQNTYRLPTVEHGALLVIAWLLEIHEYRAAQALIQTITPWFDRLRFYPIVTDKPRTLPDEQITARSVKQVTASIARYQQDTKILQQRETIQVWLPLYDAIVRLFLTIVPAETLQAESEAPSGLMMAAKPDFAVQAAQLLEDLNAAEETYHLRSRLHHPNGTFFKLRQMLASLSSQNYQFTAQHLATITPLLQRFIAKYGEPGSEKHQQLRARQAKQVAGPLYKTIQTTLLTNLKPYYEEEGLSAEEIKTLAQKTATEVNVETVPLFFTDKLVSTQWNTLEQHLKTQTIRSAEALAQQLPSLSGLIITKGIDDSNLQFLQWSLYTAFRKQRSLLLLFYQQQRQIGEIPWYSALSENVTHNSSRSQSASKVLFEQIATLVLSTFPDRILPNPLIKELRALAKQADITLPFVEELAGDIFMGGFSNKYLQAAQISAEALQSSLYARYYEIDYTQLLQIDNAQMPKVSYRALPYFEQLCEKRAGRTFELWKPATNGMILEQSQILTTHNLMPLFIAAGLEKKLENQLVYMARKCFMSATGWLQLPNLEWRQRLHKLKNAAYAWRQMVFYLSFLDPDQLDQFMAWCREMQHGQDPQFVAKFTPAMNGLHAAIAGRPKNPASEKIFVGWDDKRHWFMEPDN